ncbi:MAG TPA: ShlB/FhaC/HecB family hemolysin secretion/activation protein [Burkholderiales bacterium]|nr:ShlB/FhaC/HecB family hemolysin secretion/activation protein [Burkholderiales bacterium]
MGRCLSRVAGAAVLSMAEAAALAQVALPPQTDPGLIERRLEPRRAPPRGVQLPEMKAGPGAVAPDAVKSVKVRLKEIRIEGATAVPLERLQARAREYLYREITGADIFELARELTALYRNDGYILSQVIVPPQSLGEAVLTLRVLEGYIASVRVEAEPPLATKLAELGEKIKASRPLRADVLERYLLIANDLPGMQLRSVLSPSQTPGAADLTLIATVKKAEGYASLDNYGSKYLGPAQLTASAAANQLLGAGDQLRVTGLSTGNAELGYGQVSYTSAVGTEGLKLGAAFSRAATHPGDALQPFDVRGRSDTASASVTYPVLRTRNQSALGRLVYDHRNVDTDVLGVRVIEDRVRALRLGLTGLALDALDGRNTFDLEYSRGLDGTRPDDPLKSRAGAEGRFRKLALDYERVQRLGARWALTVGLGGQWTREPLLSSEQFFLGGRRFGRAYEPAELAGDRGLAWRMEPAWLGGEGATPYQVYVFHDVGKVWFESNADSPPRPAQSLASAGIGTRASLDRNVSLGLEAAWPLTRPVASYQATGHGDRVRVLGSIAFRF